MLTGVEFAAPAIVNTALSAANSHFKKAVADRLSFAERTPAADYLASLARKRR